MMHFLVLVISSVASAVSQTSPDTTYSGYLVDGYCFGLVRAGATALDGSNPIKNPSEHTVHCLASPSNCRPAYYLAGKNEVTGDYDIMFRLDEFGNERASALLEKYRVERDSNPRYRQGSFTVTATGVSDAPNNFLRFAQLTECNPGGSRHCDTNCSSAGNGCNVTGLSDLNLELAPPALLWGHVLCMLIGWGCLLPAGVLWARNLRISEKKVCGSPIWFQGHWILQSVGWLFQLIGFIFIFALKGPVFSSPHEILGLCVVIVGSLQPVNAQLRRLSCVGHPTAGKEKNTGRLLWEVLHKGSGYAAVIGGAINIVLGIFYARSIGFVGALITIAIVVATLSLGSMLIFTVVTELGHCFKKAEEKTMTDAEDPQHSCTASTDEDKKI
jgi:hypothetical protein